jgi:hypothetical protein
VEAERIREVATDPGRAPLAVGALLVAVVVAVLAAAPSGAATVNPKALVLRKADVPRGYTLDDMQLLGNPGSGAKESFRELAKRSGRITGYYAHFAQGTKEITSVAELFRSPGGARIYFAWYERRLQSQGEGTRSRLALGNGGWVYRVHSTPNSTFALWRDGRVVSSLLTHAMRGHRELALALSRTQDRRASAALELPPTR